MGWPCRLAFADQELLVFSPSVDHSGISSPTGQKNRTRAIGVLPLLLRGEKMPEGRMRGPSAQNAPNHPLIASHALGTSPRGGEGGDRGKAAFQGR